MRWEGSGRNPRFLPPASSEDIPPDGGRRGYDYSGVRGSRTSSGEGGRVAGPEESTGEVEGGRGGGTTTASEKTTNATTHSSIIPLSERAASSVRAGQLIGSIGRAVEGLVRNSSDHGFATDVVVTVGVGGGGGGGGGSASDRSGLEVSDDGIGMDPSAVRDRVGTERCSSSRSGIGAGARGGGDPMGSGGALRGDER